MMLANKTMHFVLAGFLVEKMSSEIVDSNEIRPTYAANQRAVFGGFFGSSRVSFRSERTNRLKNNEK